MVFFGSTPTEVKNSLDMEKLEGQWYEQTLGRSTPHRSRKDQGQMEGF